MENKLIEVENLKQHFPVSTGWFHKKMLKAVDGVSFHICKGETLGLVGESGCGKTTVGRTMLHLYKPTGGTIYFDGKPVITPEEIAAYRRKTAMVFQDPYSSLNPRMTVADIIAEPLDIQRMYQNKKERRDRVLELMEKVGLNPAYVNRYAHQFSGGQRQRIGIARALAMEPEFLVCDEPVSALDVSVQAQVVNMFSDLQQQLGLTCLFIAHDLLVVRHICDRIAVMYLGKLVELAPADRLYHHPMHPYTQCLISAVPLPDPKLARENKRILMDGEIPSPMNMPPGCPFCTRCPRATEICREKMPPLTEVETGHFAACHHIRK